MTSSILQIWAKPLGRLFSLFRPLNTILTSKTISSNLKKAVPRFCHVNLVFLIYSISWVSVLLVIAIPNYAYPNVYGIQTHQSVIQYSDSILPQNIVTENGKSNDTLNSSQFNSDISKIIMPSSPSSISSSLVVDGNNSVILFNENKNSSYNFNNFNRSQLNNNGPIDKICGYMNTVKIGYIITGSGNISGNDHDNYIIGSELDDVICAKKGNDVIMALGGNDLVYAGKGDDTLYGGDGNNQLFGEDGEDNIVGGPFNDLLVGGKGDDHIVSSSGDDVLIGGDGADYFECGSGLNTVVDFNPKQGDLVSNGCEILNNVDTQQK